MRGERELRKIHPHTVNLPEGRAFYGEMTRDNAPRPIFARGQRVVILASGAVRKH
jgi:hypothetical protein